MEEDAIRQIFLHQPAYKPSSSQGLRPAAALVPIEAERGVWLTRRSPLLLTHAGQVAFPGGKIDQEDVSAEAAALREAQEEIGLDPAQAEILGRLPDYSTVTGFHIASIVALVPAHIKFQLQTMEVEETFMLPFKDLLNPDYPLRRKVVLAGVERSFWVWPHADHVIWGATAAILRQLALRLRAAA